MGQNVFNLHVVKLDCAAEQGALVLVDASALFNFINKHQQLFLRDLSVAAGFEQFCKQLFKAGEKQSERGKNNHQKVDYGSREHAELFRILFCKALGADFAENQNNDCNNNG